MGIKDLLKKISGTKEDTKFIPDFREDNYIKIYLKQGDKNIRIDENSDEDLFVLVSITNLSVSEDNSYLYIPYEKVYELYYDETKNPIDDYKHLNLPDLYNGFIKIENKGNFNESKEVIYSFEFNNGLDYDIKRFKNNILVVNGEFRLLPQGMCEFLKEIISYNKNKEKTQDISEQFDFLSTIKDYADNTNILLNKRLSDEAKPIVIDKIKLDFIKKDDGLEIVPYVEEKDEKFNRELLSKFDSNDNIKNFYNIDDNGTKRKVIFKNKESAERVKRNRKLSGEEEQKFYIGQNEIFEDENIDLSKYGPRVKGLGYLTYRANSTMSKKSDDSWFDSNAVEELPKLHTDEEVIVLTPEHKEMLQDKLVEMERTSKEIIEVVFEVNGQTFRVPMKEEQIKAELQKINNSIVDVYKINNLSKLEEIIGKEQDNPNSEFIIHNGRYVKNPGKEEIQKRIEQVREENKNKGHKNGVKSLLIKENLDDDEYKEKTVKAKEYPLELPKSLLVESLFPHQSEGVKKLQNLYRASNINGFLLADDMGLGKTLQLLTFMAWLKESNKLTPALIVAPTTLIDNWDNDDPLNKGEVQKFFEKGTFTTYKIRGRIDNSELEKIKNSDIVLISYASLRINHIKLGEIHWSVMICDEAQISKNANTQVTVALKSQNADFKVACSATPIENTTLDLWNIMDYAVPGVLGSLNEFRKQYVNRINKLSDGDTKEREDIHNSLVSKIENNFMRRSKEEELKGLPKKIIKLYMTPASKTERGLIELLNEKRKQGESHLPLIQKMIALCSHPQLINPSRIDNVNELVNESSKLKLLKSIIDEIKSKDEKVIVFTIFQRMQEILVKTLKNWYGLNVNVVNGTIEQDKRKHILDKFRKSDGFDVIVLSPEVAGVGITLVEANHVIHYTRLWNPAKEAQATDRAYRIGQKKDVFVYYPVITFDEEIKITYEDEQDYLNTFINSNTKGKTPEEKLNKLLVRKKNLLNNFFLAAGENNINVVNEWDEDESRDEKHITLHDVLNILKPNEFEALCSLIFKRQGYKTFLTVQSGDMGVDVLAEKDGKYTLIQSKFVTSKNISRSALNEVFAAKNVYSTNLNIKVERLLVMCTAEEITRDTEEFSRINNIEILFKQDLSKLLDESKIFLSEINFENEKRYSVEQMRREL